MAHTEDSLKRKLALVKRAGLLAGAPEGVTISQARTNVELYEAYTLVHDIYVDKRYINPRLDGIRVRQFELSDYISTFTAKKGGEVIGVLSVIGDSYQLALPADYVYHDELNRMRASHRLCEISNQVVHERYRNTSIVVELMRCAFAYILKSHYTMTVATVSAQHRMFYDVIKFTQFGDERVTNELNDKVIGLSFDMVNSRADPSTMNEFDRFMLDFFVTSNPYRDVVSTATKDKAALIRFKS